MIEAIIRYLGAVANPFGIIWLLLLVFTALLLKKRLWRMAALSSALALGMSVVSSRISLSLVGTLEAPYFGQRFDTVPEADAVMMMGGVLEFSRNDPMGFNLSSSSDRIITALELMRRNKGKALIIGGGGNPGKDEPDETQALNRWLTDWKIPSAPVHLLGVCANTHDEAGKVVELAKKQGWKKIIVVTSASHMRRVVAVFRTLGLEVIPVACDFQKLGTPYHGFPNPIPSSGGFYYMDTYLHEQMGWLVYRARGWISAEAAGGKSSNQ